MNEGSDKWQELIKSFALLEKKLSSNVHDDYIDNFFSNFDVTLKELKINSRQKEVLRIKMQHIIELINLKKEEVREEQIKLLQTHSQFNAYINNQGLNNNKKF